MTEAPVRERDVPNVDKSGGDRDLLVTRGAAIYADCRHHQGKDQHDDHGSKSKATARKQLRHRFLLVRRTEPALSPAPAASGVSLVSPQGFPSCVTWRASATVGP